MGNNYHVTCIHTVCEAGVKQFGLLMRQDKCKTVDDRRCAEGTKQSVIAQAEKSEAGVIKKESEDI